MIGAKTVSTVGKTFVMVEVVWYGEVQVLVIVDVYAVETVFGTGTVAGFVDKTFEDTDFVTEPGADLLVLFETEPELPEDLTTLSVLAIGERLELFQVVALGFTEELNEVVAVVPGVLVEDGT